MMKLLMIKLFIKKTAKKIANNFNDFYSNKISKKNKFIISHVAINNF